MTNSKWFRWCSSVNPFVTDLLTSYRVPLAVASLLHSNPFDNMKFIPTYWTDNDSIGMKLFASNWIIDSLIEIWLTDWNCNFSSFFEHFCFVLERTELSLNRFLRWFQFSVTFQFISDSFSINWLKGNLNSIAIGFLNNPREIQSISIDAPVVFNPSNFNFKSQSFQLWLFRNSNCPFQEKKWSRNETNDYRRLNFDGKRGQ